jgi:hypothetical protein
LVKLAPRDLITKLNLLMHLQIQKLQCTPFERSHA